MSDTKPADRGYGRDPDRIPLILAALEREWRKAPDERLGQFLVNLIRSNVQLAETGQPSVHSVLWGTEDGKLLSWLGPESEAEMDYVREEPRRRRRGWSAWMRQSSDMRLPEPNDGHAATEGEQQTAPGPRKPIPPEDVVSGWAKTPKANKKLR